MNILIQTNKLYEFERESLLLSNYSNDEIKDFLNRLKKFGKETDSKVILEKIKEIESKAKYEILRREEWKLNLFFPLILTSFLAGSFYMQKFYQEKLNNLLIEILNNYIGRYYGNSSD